MAPVFSSLRKKVFLTKKEREELARQEAERLEAEREVQRQEPNRQEAERQDLENIHKKCSRFRVLIMGRANSGKTTLARKMCDSNEEPIVHDQDGNQLDPSVLKGPDAMRGIHDINLEITYESNKNFVIHDSMGFESGSPDEVDKVRDFIEDRLKKTELPQRLHAIWYCIPTDLDRVASKEELSFFQQNTGDIPVIVIFTKWDGLVTLSYSVLRNRERKNKQQAKLEAPLRAQKVLDEEFYPVFQNVPYPPASFVVLGDMDKAEAKCGELSEKTAGALNNGVLKKLFVSVQTHNMQLCMKGAFKEVISSVFSGSAKDESVIRVVLSWFPHLYWSNAEYSRERIRRIREGRREERDNYRRLIQPVMSTSSTPTLPPKLQSLYIAASSAIVATLSFDKRPRLIFDYNEYHIALQAVLTVIVADYVASAQPQAVQSAILSAFQQYARVASLSSDERKAVVEGLVKICVDNMHTST